MAVIMKYPKNKRELVYSILDKRNIYAIRQSNLTLLVSKRKKLIDSDRAMLEDKNGYRYVRDMRLDMILDSNHNYIFRMI